MYERMFVAVVTEGSGSAYGNRRHDPAAQGPHQRTSAHFRKKQHSSPAVNSAQMDMRPLPLSLINQRTFCY